MRLGGAAGRMGSGAATERSDKAAATAADQLSLLPRLPAAPLPVLDQRERGTRFIEWEVRSVLNTPETTRMGYWSINPYVGCEFGCSYCYARETHRFALERADRRRINSRRVRVMGNPVESHCARLRERGEVP